MVCRSAGKGILEYSKMLNVDLDHLNPLATQRDYAANVADGKAAGQASAF